MHDTFNEIEMKNIFSSEKKIQKNIDIKLFTEKDFDDMTFDELLLYDKRSYFKRLLNILKNENSLLSIIFKRSIIYPMHMRIFSFLFDFLIDCGANAIFYSDEYITKRYENSDNKV